MIFQIIKTILYIVLIICVFILIILGNYDIAKKIKTSHTDICVNSVILGTGPDDCEIYLTVGKHGVKKIIYHKPSYKGDISYVDVYRENGNITRHFHFTNIVYKEKES